MVLLLPLLGGCNHPSWKEVTFDFDWQPGMTWRYADDEGGHVTLQVVSRNFTTGTQDIFLLTQSATESDAPKPVLINQRTLGRHGPYVSPMLIHCRKAPCENPTITYQDLDPNGATLFRNHEYVQSRSEASVNLATTSFHWRFRDTFVKYLIEVFMQEPTTWDSKYLGTTNVIPIRYEFSVWSSTPEFDAVAAEEERRGNDIRSMRVVAKWSNEYQNFVYMRVDRGLPEAALSVFPTGTLTTQPDEYWLQASQQRKLNPWTALDAEQAWGGDLPPSLHRPWGIWVRSVHSPLTTSVLGQNTTLYVDTGQDPYTKVPTDWTLQLRAIDAEGEVAFSDTISARQMNGIGGSNRFLWNVTFPYATSYNLQGTLRTPNGEVRGTSNNTLQVAFEARGAIRCPVPSLPLLVTCEPLELQPGTRGAGRVTVGDPVPTQPMGTVVLRDAAGNELGNGSTGPNQAWSYEAPARTRRESNPPWSLSWTPTAAGATAAVNVTVAWTT